MGAALLLVVVSLAWSRWAGRRPDNGPRPGPIVDLASQAVGDSTTGQVVAWNDRITVALPPGSVTGNGTLVIGGLTTPTGPLPPGAVELASASLRLDGPASLTAPVAVAFRFDPALVEPAPGASAPAVVGCCWDETLGMWLAAPTALDATRGVAVVMTRHFSIWRVLYLGKGYLIRDTTHFRVVHAENHDMILGSRLEEAPQAAFTTGTMLENAWRSYDRAGFTMPGTSWDQALQKLLVAIPNLDLTPGKTWIFLNCRDWWVTSEKMDSTSPYRSGTTGAIYLKGSYDDLDELRGVTAHEYFHAVQNEYMNIYSLGLRYWWIDATADYAAEKVAWEGKIAGMGEGISATWLDTPLWAADGLKEYRTAHFIDFVLGPTGAGQFPALWRATMEGVWLQSVITRLDAHLQQTTSRPLGSWFREFAAFLLFSSATPCRGERRFLGSPTAAQRLADLPADQVARPLALSTTSGLCAAVTGIRPAFRTGQAFRRLRVSWLEASRPEMTVDLVRLPGNREVPRVRPEPLAGVGASATVTLRPGDVLWVLACNTALTEGGGQVSLNVLDESVDLGLEGTPDRAKLTKVTFTATARGVPPGAGPLTCRWRFDDGDFGPSQPVPVPTAPAMTWAREEEFPAITAHTAGLQLLAGSELLAETACEVKTCFVQLEPRAVLASPGQEVAFRAVVANPPPDPLFRWSFGEGQAGQETTVPEARHAWPAPGEFPVQVVLLAASRRDAPLDRSAGTARIEAGSPPPAAPAGNLDPPPGCLNHDYSRLTRHDEPTDVYYTNASGVREGWEIRWHDEGRSRKAFEGCWHEGEQQCRHRHWYPDGQPEFEATFDQGVNEGPCRRWYANGQLNEEATYHLGAVSGRITTWYDTGKVMSETDVETGPEEIQEPVFADRKPHRVLTVIGGKTVNYYPDGKKKEQRITRHNQYQGQHLYWNEKGVLIREENYRDGKLDGPFRTFYPDSGNLCSEYVYGNGLRQGLYRLLRDNGTVKIKGQYRDNHMVGEWLLFTPDGKVKDRMVDWEGENLDWAMAP